MKFRLYYFLAIILIGGCATPSTTGVKFYLVDGTSEEKAIIYVYRPAKDFNNKGWVNIMANDEKKFVLVNNSYGFFTLNSGEYEIQAEGSKMGTNWWPGPAATKISVTGGQDYYVRMFPFLPPGVKASPALFTSGAAQVDIMEVEKSLALEEISRTELVEIVGNQ